MLTGFEQAAQYLRSELDLLGEDAFWRIKHAMGELQGNERGIAHIGKDWRSEWEQAKQRVLGP